MIDENYVPRFSRNGIIVLQDGLRFQQFPVRRLKHDDIRFLRHGAQTGKVRCLRHFPTVADSIAVKRHGRAEEFFNINRILLRMDEPQADH